VCRFLGLALTIHTHIVPMVRMSRTMSLFPFFDETFTCTFPIQALGEFGSELLKFYIFVGS